MDDDLVTIVIPTHNRPTFLDRAVQSALSQTHSNIEVIVVDDGSDPKASLTTIDPRARLLRIKQEGGPGRARNFGLAAAKGTYITFLDDDDQLLPDMVLQSLELLRLSPLPKADAVISGYQVVDPHDNRLGAKLPPAPLQVGGNSSVDAIPGPVGVTLLCRTARFKEIGGWDECFLAFEHTDVLLRLHRVCSIETSPRIVYLQTDHDGPRLHRNYLASARGRERLLQKHSDVYAAKPATKAQVLAAAGLNYLRAGEWLSAVRLTGRSVVAGRYRPRFITYFVAAISGPAFPHLRRGWRFLNQWR